MWRIISSKLIMKNNIDDFEYSCSNCNNPVGKDDKFCKNCGADLSEVVYEDDNKIIYHCDTCGIEIPSDYKFCKNCGSKVLREKICSYCNKSFKEDGDYCPNCGKPFR